MSEKTNGLTIAAALAGALSMVSLLPAHGAAAAEASGLEKCYGISKAGQNSCANEAGTHSCAGQSAKDYDGGEWRAVRAGVCTEMGGKLAAFNGVGMPKDMTRAATPAAPKKS
ncbi:BufA1 family periplasmic bufferin-type metallophore [Azospirillum endophyticum]